MKKYIFMRVLRSLVSIFLVTTLTYTIIYTLVPRKLIFKQDPNYNKIATTADKRDNYENTVFERMGYIEYYDTKELQEKASSMDSSVTVEANATNKAIYEKYINQLGHGGLWENLLKVVNSMLLVKFQFLNVFFTSMLT
ncbi:peptide ABC transporter permease [Streptococcus pneumoniae]|nr:peptide ABC transporter permease [Streptococcus pneumoniae]